ncbi:hypothetical protein EUX98_g1263 [Antrodiella citrinella]|uniref:Uncharacterized protein n=1 Tax=Antrodiella citrinella TaxID=2447956 RepID=A0A4S4N1U8_9APHY|nr:hypothetical protein EUX98_g1263 [Antrodiella citrinella]
MRFGTRNLYYLRISSSIVLPLYLYLDEKHVDWMSDRTLQHVLADLRHRIPEKLTSEADAGGSANAKKGTLDVHRGDSYQFGYFLRNTEAHAVVIKTRRFVAAPPHPPPAPVAQQSEPAKSSKKGKGKRAASQKVKPTKKPKTSTKGKGKGKARAIDSEEEEDIINVSSDQDEDEDMPAETEAPVASSGPLRRSSRKTNVATYIEGNEGGEDEDLEPTPIDDDIEMSDGRSDRPPDAPNPPGDLPFDVGGLISMDADDEDGQIPATDTPAVKTEEADIPLELFPPPQNPEDTQGTPAPPPAPGDDINTPLEIEEEEEKPKPILKLNYKGFNIHGKCLCVIVEPYPPIQTALRAMSLAPMGVIAPRAPSIAPPDYVPPSVAAQRRAKTPLFLPEDDRDRSVTPAPWGAPEEPRMLPPVPLFSDTPESNSGGFEDGGMYEFSQILRSVGGYPAGAAEDDDEMDGAALFGDADDVRELQ